MITIYGKSSCPYCQMAKNLCETKNLEHNYVDIFSSPETEKEYRELAEKNTHMTVPLILIDDVFLGGFDDLQKKLMG